MWNTLSPTTISEAFDPFKLRFEHTSDLDGEKLEGKGHLRNKLSLQWILHKALEFKPHDREIVGFNPAGSLIKVFTEVPR